MESKSFFLVAHFKTYEKPYNIALFFSTGSFGNSPQRIWPDMLGLVNVDFWFQIYDKWQELWAGLFMRKGLMIVVYFDFIWMGLMRIVYSCHFWCAACSMLYSFLHTHTAATHMKPFAITFFSSYQEGRRSVRSNMQLSPSERNWCHSHT